MRSTSPTGPSAARSTACASVGSGPVMSWPSAPRCGGSQKGAETRPRREATRAPADARRDDHHGDPPLYSAYGHIGQQVRVPITGNRAKRIVHGAINIKSGDVALLITEEWVNETHQ